MTNKYVYRKLSLPSIRTNFVTSIQVFFFYVCSYCFYLIKLRHLIYKYNFVLNVQIISFYNHSIVLSNYFNLQVGVEGPGWCMFVWRDLYMFVCTIEIVGKFIQYCDLAFAGDCTTLHLCIKSKIISLYIFNIQSFGRMNA